MTKHIKLQKDYTLSELNYQIKLPLNLEKLIPDNDSVRLLSSFVEGMDLTDLYRSYGKIKKTQASPRQLFKIIVYAAMNHIYSSRQIQTSCSRDINFMYLLEGMPVPDHATIARFISIHFSNCSKKTLAEVSDILYELGEVSGIQIFIDGTKIESVANKYTFVWKKAVTKSMQRMAGKIGELLELCEERFALKLIFKDSFSLHALKKIRKKLYQLKEKEQIEFVHGSGKRKGELQKAVETLEGYIDKLKEYIKKLHICGNRNSYSKTDTDATFMRMKEDAMKNGQLKAAYNLQHGVDGGYITWLTINSNPTDTRTLIPFLKEAEHYLSFKYRDIVADAGYESEENYIFLEENGQLSFIKPTNYEISKTRKYKEDISRMENMSYDADTDTYTCRNGKLLKVERERTEKTDSGYARKVTIYKCEECKDCPYKSACIKGNNCKTPIEEREKYLHVSKTMQEKRKEDLERILSDRGTQLRVNRSIQAEGSFAEIKQDMEFRRYLYRGKKNVLAQSILIAIGHNINKLHFKIQSGKTGQHLHELATV